MLVRYPTSLPVRRYRPHKVLRKLFYLVDFVVYTRFDNFLLKTVRFDGNIKSNVPRSRCFVHQYANYIFNSFASPDTTMLNFGNPKCISNV